jgi:hypothetical protein
VYDNQDKRLRGSIQIGVQAQGKDGNDAGWYQNDDDDDHSSEKAVNYVRNTYSHHVRSRVKLKFASMFMPRNFRTHHPYDPYDPYQ